MRVLDRLERFVLSFGSYMAFSLSAACSSFAGEAFLFFERTILGLIAFDSNAVITLLGLPPCRLGTMALVRPPTVMRMTFSPHGSIPVFPVLSNRQR